jgi:serine protease Do
MSKQQVEPRRIRSMEPVSPRANTWLRSVALVGAGAAAAVLATRVHVTFDGERAHAAPPATPPSALAAATVNGSAAINEAKSVSRAFAQVAEQLKPSVVSIVVEKNPRPMRGRGRVNPFRGSPFEHFFDSPFGGNGGDDDEGNPFGGGKQVGAGSGFVIDKSGYIVTNNHVVEGTDVIKVRFADGRELKATIKGTDPKTDLAVIKVDGKDLVAARWGDADKVQPGEWVVAVGNPYGLDHTVTVGVISAKGRYGVGGGTTYEDYLQTDAAINPGNSGGPLVDLDGEVVGINTAIRGIGTMIGFAIPASMARPIVKQLIDEGRVHRPYVGILMQDLTPQIAGSLGGGAPAKGAIVGQIEPRSPAAQAGIQTGDVIVRVDGVPVDGSKAVQRAVLAKSLGQKVAFEVWRGGKSMTLAATTAEHPGDKGDRRLAGEPEAGDGKARLGLALQNLTPDLAERLGVDAATRGAVVGGVRDGSPAADAGIREGDLIVEVDRQPVASADDVSRALKVARPGGHLVRIRRGDGALFIPLP